MKQYIEFCGRIPGRFRVICKAWGISAIYRKLSVVTLRSDRNNVICPLQAPSSHRCPQSTVGDVFPHDEVRLRCIFNGVLKRAHSRTSFCRRTHYLDAPCFGPGVVDVYLLVFLFLAVAPLPTKGRAAQIMVGAGARHSYRPSYGESPLP